MRWPLRLRGHSTIAFIRRTKHKFLCVAWLLVIFYHELAISFIYAARCDWPLTSAETPSTNVLVIADPQILDHRSYPDRPAFLVYLSRLYTDLSLRKNWGAVLTKHPDAIVFLGDMMDSARYSMSDEEYEAYHKRFTSIFRQRESQREGASYKPAPVYYVPGNHDIGLGAFDSSFSAQARERYLSHFGSMNSQMSVGNHTLVLLDAPSLVEEDNERLARSQTLYDWRPFKGGALEFISNLSKNEIREPVILFTHIPLWRPEGTNCGPHRERGTIRSGLGKGYQNTLHRDVTRFILEKLHPTRVFSGDDHDYCEHTHHYQAGSGKRTAREVTVKSLSIAMGIEQPGFQLLSLASPATPENAASADALCLMPRQLEIYVYTYGRFFVFSVAIILLWNCFLPKQSEWDPAHESPLTLDKRNESRRERRRGQREGSKYDLPLHASSSQLPKLYYRPRSYVRGCVEDLRDVALLPIGLYIFLFWLFMGR